MDQMPQQTSEPDYLAWRGFILGLHVAKQTFNLKPTLDEHLAQFALLGAIADGTQTIRGSPADSNSGDSDGMRILVNNDQKIAEQIRRFMASQSDKDT